MLTFLAQLFIFNRPPGFRLPPAKTVFCVPALCSWRVPGLAMAVLVEEAVAQRDQGVFPVALMALGWVCLAGFPDHRLQAVGH